MGVLESSHKQKQVFTLLFGVLFASVTVLAILLVANASKLSSSTGVTVSSIGSLRLFEVSKLPLAGGGYSGGFRLLSSGMATYFGCWAAIAIGLVAWRLRK